MVLMFIATVLGIVGIAIFGFLGLQTAGPGRELDQIYTIVFTAMAAGGMVGIWGQRYDRKHHIEAPGHA